jgi:hypothetical protein
MDTVQKFSLPVYVYKLPHIQARFVCNIPDDKACRCESASGLGVYIADMIHEMDDVDATVQSLFDACVGQLETDGADTLVVNFIPEHPLHAGEIEPELLTEKEYASVLRALTEELQGLHDVRTKLDNGELPLPFDVA